MTDHDAADFRPAVLLGPAVRVAWRASWITALIVGVQFMALTAPWGDATLFFGLIAIGVALVFGVPCWAVGVMGAVLLARVLAPISWRGHAAFWSIWIGGLAFLVAFGLAASSDVGRLGGLVSLVVMIPPASGATTVTTLGAFFSACMLGAIGALSAQVMTRDLG